MIHVGLLLTSALLALGADPAPPPTTQLTATRVWTVDSTDDLVFGCLRRIARRDDGLVVFLDVRTQSVHAFLADGTYQGVVNSKGEGPGKADRPSELWFEGDDLILIQWAPFRLALMDHDLNPVDTLTPALLELPGSGRLSEAQRNGPWLAYLQTNQVFDGLTSSFLTTLAVTPDLDTTPTEIANESLDLVLSAPELHLDIAPMSRHWTLGPNGTVYFSRTFDTFEVETHSAAGTRGAIQRPNRTVAFPKVESSQMVRRTEKLFSQFATQKAPRIHPAKERRVIQALNSRPSGDLWVLAADRMTWATSPTLGPFEVYDSKGIHRADVQIQLDVEQDPRRDQWFLQGDWLFLVRGGLQARDEYELGPVELEEGERLPWEELGEDHMTVIAYRLSQ